MGFFTKTLSCFKGSNRPKSKKKGLRVKDGEKDASFKIPAISGRLGNGSEKKGVSVLCVEDDATEQRRQRNMKLFETYVQKLKSGDGACSMDGDDYDERLKKNSGWMVVRTKGRYEGTSIMGGSMRCT